MNETQRFLLSVGLGSVVILVGIFISDTYASGVIAACVARLVSDLIDRPA